MKHAIAACAAAVAALAGCAAPPPPAAALMAVRVRIWPSLCSHGLCAQAGRHEVIARPFSTAPRQSAVWVSPVPPAYPPCGPGGWAPVIVRAAPYWCPFSARALDTQFAGLPYGTLGIGASYCAGALRAAAGGWVAVKDLCWEPGTWMVRQPGTGSPLRLVDIVASDAAGQAMYLAAPASPGQPLAWSAAGPAWHFRCGPQPRPDTAPDPC
jgi:hypothetical protein